MVHNFMVHGVDPLVEIVGQRRQHGSQGQTLDNRESGDSQGMKGESTGGIESTEGECKQTRDRAYLWGWGSSIPEATTIQATIFEEEWGIEA
jgi:hypothetical protein